MKSFDMPEVKLRDISADDLLSLWGWRPNGSNLLALPRKCSSESPQEMLRVIHFSTSHPQITLIYQEFFLRIEEFRRYSDICLVLHVTLRFRIQRSVGIDTTYLRTWHLTAWVRMYKSPSLLVRSDRLDNHRLSSMMHAKSFRELCNPRTFSKTLISCSWWWSAWSAWHISGRRSTSWVNNAQTHGMGWHRVWRPLTVFWKTSWTWRCLSDWLVYPTSLVDVQGVYSEFWV